MTGSHEARSRCVRCGLTEGLLLFREGERKMDRRWRGERERKKIEETEANSKKVEVGFIQLH
jgi:hypothetical protein